VEVQYVELFASVSDSDGRPILDLERESFAVFEDGVEQQVRRFEYVKNLPIHACMLLDTSASMEESLESVSHAARTFVEQSITEKDRVALISFDDRPQVDVHFSNESNEVARALAALKAEGSTALYDSLVYALHYFHGVKGQRALLLLSDGKDEASYFKFDAALEVARRSGVTIYVVGLKEAAKDKDSRKVLRRMASETGGQSYFIEDVAELAEIYRTIQEELRSQYLLAYQSTSEKDASQFRTIRVDLIDQKGEVRTMSGYYP
jgi:Ca-activated chloride channel family protein